jgi:6-phosphogluconate dehydrogenase
MKIGVIGLGRMGGNITRRFMQNGHKAVVYDHDPKAVAALGRDGAPGAEGLNTLVSQLRALRAIWLMLRFRSRRDHTFAEKILSAMRKGFGAHVEPKDRKAKPS